jgi:hypothetical protein
MDTIQKRIPAAKALHQLGEHDEPLALKSTIKILSANTEYLKPDTFR